MPPHLHPKSRATSSLFAATVIASFFVVTIPHVLPCPAPRVVLADGEMIIDQNGRRRRRRKPQNVEVKDGIAQFGSISPEDVGSGEKIKRECPVPKPSGKVGELLGFKSTKESDHVTKARP